MNFILKLLINALAIYIIANFLNGVTIDTYIHAIGVALVISVLNLIIKPILILLTLPITIITLGLFLLVINAIIILLANQLVPGFRVDGFWTAIIFSILLSILQSVFNLFTPTEH